MKAWKVMRLASIAVRRLASGAFGNSLFDGQRAPTSYGLMVVRLDGMTAPLIVSIPHKLGQDEARRRLTNGLTRAASSFPVLTVEEERWSGDHMDFRVRALGQAASGSIDVAEDHVRLEVFLPWLLAKFAEVVQSAIRASGRLLLERK